jgi:hypothetical protein
MFSFFRPSFQAVKTSAPSIIYLATHRQFSHYYHVLKILKHHKRSATRFLQFLQRNPSYARSQLGWVKHFPKWWNSLDLSTESISREEPWIVYDATEWLKKNLQDSFAVFEYGAGASTLFFAKRVSRVVSVEHNPKWHKSIVEKTQSLGFSHCEHHLVEPEECGITRGPYLTGHRIPHFEGQSFERYVKVIDDYPDRSFDLVLIDGRARADCLRHAIPKVRNGGYIMLDDSGRTRYQEARQQLSDFEEIDFYGVKPQGRDPSHTTAWRIS